MLYVVTESVQRRVLYTLSFREGCAENAFNIQHMNDFVSDSSYFVEHVFFEPSCDREFVDIDLGA